MGGHPHPEQLVHSHPEHVEHLGVDALDRSVRGQRDDSVVVAPTTQRAVAELGREPRVGRAQARLGDPYRKDEVRVGVVISHSRENIHDHEARGAHAAHRRPRHQSTPDIARLPAGCTVTSSIGALPVPARSRPPRSS